MFMEIVANKLRLDPSILSPRWLLRFLAHQFTHIPTDEGNPEEIRIIKESKGFLQLQPSQIMGGVMPNIKSRDFKERFKKLLKGSKALIYVEQGDELFESGKLNRTIKKKRKGGEGKSEVSEDIQTALIPEIYNSSNEGYNVTIAMALDSISPNLGLSWFEEQPQEVTQEQTQQRQKKTRKNKQGGRRRKKTSRKRRKSKRRR